MELQEFCSECRKTLIMSNLLAQFQQTDLRLKEIEAKLGLKRTDEPTKE